MIGGLERVFKPGDPPQPPLLRGEQESDLLEEISTHGISHNSYAKLDALANAIANIRLRD